MVVNPNGQIDEGSTLLIVCRTTGKFAKLTWEKEGKKVADELITNKKPFFESGEVINESILKIDDVKLEDVGIYMCKSVSRFDSTKMASTTAIVNVRGGFFLLYIYYHSKQIILWCTYCIVFACLINFIMFFRSSNDGEMQRILSLYT